MTALASPCPSSHLLGGVSENINPTPANAGRAGTKNQVRQSFLIWKVSPDACARRDIRNEP
jgi:hypothetical protein